MTRQRAPILHGPQDHVGSIYRLNPFCWLLFVCPSAGHGDGEFPETFDLDLRAVVVSFDGAIEFQEHLLAAEIEGGRKG